MALHDTHEVEAAIVVFPPDTAVQADAGTVCNATVKAAIDAAASGWRRNVAGRWHMHCEAGAAEHASIFVFIVRRWLRGRLLPATGISAVLPTGVKIVLLGAEFYLFDGVCQVPINNENFC